MPSTPELSNYRFPNEVLVPWAVTSGVRVAVTSGVLVYLAKYLDVEKHFFILLIVDNVVCLVMSMAGFVNYVMMIHGVYYNLTSCYFNFFLGYYMLLVGTVTTALLSVFRYVAALLRDFLFKTYYVTGERYYGLKKALNKGSISQTTIKCVCLLAFVMTLAHSGSNLIAFLAMKEESPLMPKSVQVCLHGAAEHKAVWGLLFAEPIEVLGYVFGAASLLISCALFLIHDIMTVRLLRTNATDNPEIQRRRFSSFFDESFAHQLLLKDWTLTELNMKWSLWWQPKYLVHLPWLSSFWLDSSARMTGFPGWWCSALYKSLPQWEVQWWHSWPSNDQAPIKDNSSRK